MDKKRGLLHDVFSILGSRVTAATAQQTGNAIRSHIKKGDISMHRQKSHSPEAPGEEGGRNHNHPYNFLPFRK